MTVKLPIESLDRGRQLPFLGNEDVRLRITDDVTKSVVFFGVPDDTPGLGGIKCAGTGFFIGHEGTGYLVTAKHLAAALQGAPFLIRLNKKDGTSANLPVDELHWTPHPDLDVDVAVVPFHVPKVSEFECLYYKSERIGDSKVLERDGIGIGDLTYTVGLFRLLSGEKRNLPIVHSGSIARTPGVEKIPVRDWEDPFQKKTRFIHGFLIETSSLSGLSGSPVFVRASLQLEMEGKILGDGDKWSGVLPRNRALLMGLWQGSWDAPPDEIMAAEIQRGARVPIGIGVVIPIDKVMEVLDLPNLKLRRQKLAAARAFEGSAVPDSALPIASATGFWEGSMNVLESMQERISSALAPVLDKDGILVPTPVLYPSNGNVVVYITGGLKSCVVSDRGDVLRTVRAHGVNIPNVNQWLGHMITWGSMCAI